MVPHTHSGSQSLAALNQRHLAAQDLAALLASTYSKDELHGKLNRKLLGLVERAREQCGGGDLATAAAELTRLNRAAAGRA